MKNLLFTTFFIFLSALSVFGQNCTDIDDCNKKLSEASQMIEKLLSIEERDTKAINDKQAEIEKLKIVIAEQEKAKLTPCTLSAEKVKQDLTYWLAQFDGASPEKQKEIKKNLKMVRGLGKKSIKAQCGYDSKSVWSMVWDAAKVVAPVGAIILTR